tara:strand:- start:251 stop:586 length:336 start_codon:yes stop_codon:yes gene_type:complete
MNEQNNNKIKLDNFNKKFVLSLEKLKERKARLTRDISMYEKEKETIITQLKHLKTELEKTISILVDKKKVLYKTEETIDSTEKLYKQILSASENLLKVILKEENQQSNKKE